LMELWDFSKLSCIVTFDGKFMNELTFGKFHCERGSYAPK